MRYNFFRAITWASVGMLSLAQPTAAQTTWWKPLKGLTWDWQLKSPITVTPSANIAVYDIDMFDNDASVIGNLHAAGRKVICYIETQYEDYRPDSKSFPTSIIGNAYDGWPGEWWVDIRSQTLWSIMDARIAKAKLKGCDGMEFDNLDSYLSDTGFPLTADDQIRFNLFLANAAHSRGMAAGLKNDLDQIQSLVNYFDYAIIEQCFQYKECSYVTPFLNANKPVFEAEYSRQTSAFCPQALNSKVSAIKKHLSLDAYRQSCQ
jgi:hypothetical protein